MSTESFRYEVKQAPYAQLTNVELAAMKNVGRWIAAATARAFKLLAAALSGRPASPIS